MLARGQLLAISHDAGSHLLPKVDVQVPYIE